MPKILHNSQETTYISQIQEEINKVGDKPVLFLSQQQLAILGSVKVNNPVFDFDFVYLTEYLMAQNDDQYKKFVDNLSSNSYALIIGPPLINLRTKSLQEDPFAEENNIWVTKSYTILSYYEPILIYGDIGIAVYEPAS